MTREALPVALLALVRRNRRRYGGYIVHVGIAVLLVGVAASSAFQHARDVRLAPGQTAVVNGYSIHYVRATSHLAAEKITFGAVLDVSKGGRHVTTLRPSRGYYPSLDQRDLGVVGRFFDGDSTSEVGLRAGLRRDIWTAVQPSLGGIQRFIATADRRFANIGPQAIPLLVAAIAQRYQTHPGSANFRLIVSPMVTWIWLGGLILIVGAIVAIWPPPRTAPRRVSAAYRARLEGELGHA